MTDHIGEGGYQEGIQDPPDDLLSRAGRPRPSVSPPPVEDAELERLINLMDYRARNPGYSGPSSTGRALRSRIRELVGEALLNERRRILRGVESL